MSSAAFSSRKGESRSTPLTPLEDLSELASRQGATASPFDDDELYSHFFEHLARSLCRKSSRHVALRREKGVGESVALLEFARRVGYGAYPALGRQFIKRLDLRHSGVDNACDLFRWLHETIEPDSILVLDGLNNLLSTGDTLRAQSCFTAFTQLTRARLIVTMTQREFDEHLFASGAMDELFSVVELSEPGQDAAIRLVRHFASGLSRLHGVEISEDAVKKAVSLSVDFIPSSRLPAKAVRILSEACEDLIFDASLGRAEGNTISAGHIVRRIAAVSGLPESTISGLPDGIDYRKLLSERVFGQEQVVDEVATELSLIRAGMVDGGKPASVMLFVGQTGTGKTELAKAIAQLYSTSRRLKTFTLGNYSEPHSVSGIIGVPPGYVGHDHGGRLVNELNADPYGVFLLDEADKAHPDVMQPFLNLFDEGWIVDQRGVKAHGDRAIFVLTTNVGQRQISEMQKKGKDWQEIQDKLMESLSQIRHAKANRPVFSPEFLARLKKVLIFRSLDQSAMASITRQQSRELALRWMSSRGKTLEIDDEVIVEIANRATIRNDESRGKEGGRIVRKLISSLVEAPIQLTIASQQNVFKQCRTIVVRKNSEFSGACYQVELT